MLSRGPGQPPHENLHQKISCRGKENHLLGRQWERALAAVDGIPHPHVDQSFKKKRPYMMRMFVHDRSRSQSIPV
ncbi:hypothetical protein E2C01_008787 [Portunus trituberculatus]|uniref:Uncharacterized protein n=1 Tax=Portunus trituberculatus TaxID=210409 RepID=A0A5B7D3X0_PORTR|nr:hypothetical protein [Portunus trituberculatus]